MDNYIQIINDNYKNFNNLINNEIINTYKQITNKFFDIKYYKSSLIKICIFKQTNYMFIEKLVFFNNSIYFNIDNFYIQIIPKDCTKINIIYLFNYLQLNENFNNIYGTIIYIPPYEEQINILKFIKNKKIHIKNLINCNNSLLDFCKNNFDNFNN